MALTIKTLAAGTKTATDDLYPVPANKSAVVYGIRLVNNGSNPATINLYARPSGGPDWRIYEKDYSLAAGAMVLVDDPLTLGAGEKVRLGISGSSPSLHFMISGVERDT
ncbi:MAG: hypothetical protein HYY24_05355 [Verrucomicrobia bacterium]|nr:hypothetical protein [Verrucomicrobiota bacterium]